MCFRQKKGKNRNNNKTINQTFKQLPESEIESGTSRTQSGCVTSAHTESTERIDCSQAI